MNYAESVLAHYGVLGMKWGVHKEREKQIRKRMATIQKTQAKNLYSSDVKRFAYRNQPLALRAGKMATVAIAQTLVSDAFSGKLGNYSKQDVIKRMRNVALVTAANVKIEDSLAESAAKRYTETGKIKRGQKEKLLTKEDVIEESISIGMKALGILSLMRSVKVGNASYNQKQAGKINGFLEDQLPNVIWTDGNTSIFDKRSR